MSDEYVTVCMQGCAECPNVKQRIAELEKALEAEQLARTAMLDTIEGLEKALELTDGFSTVELRKSLRAVLAGRKGE